MRRAMLLLTVLALAASACSPSAPEATPDPAEPPAVAGTAEGTEPGTDLGLGDQATLVWQPTADVTGEVDLTVETVAEQRRSVFDGWIRDDVMAASRPYFVTVTVSNAGEDDLGGQDVPLYLRDDDGTLGAPWTLGGDFAACQSGPLPTPFESGSEKEMCLVYLVPGGARIRDLVFEPTEGYDPITWSGDVQEREKRSDKKSDKTGAKTGKKRG